MIIFTGPTFATNSTYYVDINHGSNSNDGSSQHPWSTINYAASRVSSGDTVIISNGTYSVNQNIHITSSGSQSSPITFRGSGDKTVIDGSTLDGSSYDKRDIFFIDEADFVNIENMEIKNAYRAGIRVSQSDYVSIKKVKSHDNGVWGIFTDFSNNLLIENCECYGSKDEHGIYASNSGDHPTIRGNKIHDNNGCGLHMNGDISMGGDGIITRALVENNIIYNNGIAGGSGINCDGVQNSIIRNNLLYNNHASGISLYRIDAGGESNNNLVYHNTVVVPSDGRWALNLGSSQNKIYNNILLNNNVNRGSITVKGVTGLQSDYNIITTNQHPFTHDDGSYPSFSQWQASGLDQHSIQATIAQIFSNLSLNNYTLKNGSPAIDKGSAQYTSTKDIMGNNRPQGNGYDMGAYEYVANPLAPTITSTNPTRDAVNLPINTKITITFNKLIKAANMYVELKNPSGTSLNLTKTITGNTLILIPWQNLARGTRYSVILHTGCITDLSGNPLAAYTTSFTTIIDAKAPTVTTSDPANNDVNVARNKVIKVTFSEPLKWETFWIELKNGAGTVIPITKSITGNVLTITPSSLLTANTKYKICLHTGCVTDYAGNPLVAKVINFTSGKT